MKILLAGFEPYGKDGKACSFDAVEKIPNKIEKAEIVKVKLPLVAEKVVDELIEIVKKEEPDYIVLVGQSGYKFNVTPKRVAINLDDFDKEDNAGNKPQDQPIAKDGPNAYFTTLPSRDIVKRLIDVNIPSRVSNTIGGFVYNHVTYGILHYIHKNDLNINAGMIDIPLYHEQVLTQDHVPAMSLNAIVIAIEEALKACIKYDGPKLKSSMGIND